MVGGHSLSMASSGAGTPRSLFAAAVDLLDDAVLILDVAGRVLCANAAARRLPASLRVDVGDAVLPRAAAWVTEDVLRGARAELRSGRPWRGTLTADSDDGSTTVDLVATAVVEGDAVVGYAVVWRDQTGQRHRDSAWAMREADHHAVLSIMGQVRPEASIEETTTALIEAMKSVDWIDGVMVFLLPEGGDLVNVTSSVPAEIGFDVGGSVPLDRLEELILATSQSPWAIDLTTEAAGVLFGTDLVAGMLATGLRASAYAAIRSGERVIGVLSVASTRDDGAAVLAERLSGLDEFGRLAGAVLGAQAVAYTRREELRQGIRDTIDHRALHTVVQPIVDLATGEVCSYEAPTRFDDGRPPDLWIREAHEAGIGLELEVACARLAVEAAPSLPDGPAMAVNLSPQSILADGVLAVLAGAGRDVVVEVTEHEQIDDYGAIRDAINAEPGLRLAVDDAGAGFASLRHILELRPDLVKIDMGLVRGIHQDPARAAMVAGMVHFARLTGTKLVAEGVEVREEADTLAELGVEAAQGYLFGRPAPP